MSNVSNVSNVRTAVIVRSSTGEVVEWCEGSSLFRAMRAYAVKIGADPDSVKDTRYGIRLTVPGQGDFRATFR